MNTNSPGLKKRPRVAQVLPTECLACDSIDGYRCESATSTIDFRKEPFEVSYMRMVCPHCGHSILTDVQATDRVRKTIAAYQKRCGFLTAADVIRRRKALGLTKQQDLCEAAPEIAIATLKRIEAGQHAQDKATDIILRLALERLETERENEETFALLEMEMPKAMQGITYSLKAMSPASWIADLPMAACITFCFSSITFSAALAQRGNAETSFRQSEPQQVC